MSTLETCESLVLRRIKGCHVQDEEDARTSRSVRSISPTSTRLHMTKSVFHPRVNVPKRLLNITGGSLKGTQYAGSITFSKSALFGVGLVGGAEIKTCRLFSMADAHQISKRGMRLVPCCTPPVSYRRPSQLASFTTSVIERVIRPWFRLAWIARAP